MWPISRHPVFVGSALLGTIIACGFAASGDVAIAQSTIIQRTDSITVEPAEPGTDAPAAAPSGNSGSGSGTGDSGIVDIPDGTVDGQLPPVSTSESSSSPPAQGRDWEFDSLESASGGFGEGETRAAFGIVGTVSTRDIPRDPDSLDRWHAIHNVCDGHLSLGELTALFPSIDSALVEEVCQ